MMMTTIEEALENTVLQPVLMLAPSKDLTPEDQMEAL